MGRPLPGLRGGGGTYPPPRGDTIIQLTHIRNREWILENLQKMYSFMILLRSITHYTGDATKILGEALIYSMGHMSNVSCLPHLALYDHQSL